MNEGKPRNLVASVKRRLMNLARKQGEDFQLVLTRYVIERFLYRLSRSATATNSFSRGPCSSESGLIRFIDRRAISIY
jgi:hypothetical protein